VAPVPKTTSTTLPGFDARRGKQSWDRHTWLYVSVIVAVLLGATVGLIWPQFAEQLEPIGKGFVALIKMMIAPIIFCTIVVGIGSIAKAATVGKIGGLALL
jgi:aerobic C4-dicarboxylate transport protein